MEAFLAEEKGIKQGIAPQSVTGSTVSGARVPLQDMHRVAVVISVAAAASAALSATLKQHDAASAGNSKDLSVSNLYYHKSGAETSFTKVEPSAAAAAYDLFALIGTDAGVVVLEVLQEDLDVENDFDHISVDVAGDTTARVLGAVYLGESEKLPAYEVAL